jgi:tetratricopeptide (TPR) repeat protein
MGMGMRIDILICTVLAAIALSSPATTASERDRGDCSGNDPALMIRGCTQVIEDASESDSNRALALYRGLAYVARGDNDRAITDYNEAIRLNPTNGLTFNERGLAYKAKGDVDRAIADLNEAIRLNSGNADIHYNRGHMLMEKGDLDRAIADFDEAIRLGPNSIIAIAKDDAITRLTIDRIKANYFGIRGQAKFLLTSFADARVGLRALHTVSSRRTLHGAAALSRAGTIRTTNRRNGIAIQCVSPQAIGLAISSGRAFSRA